MITVYLGGIITILIHYDWETKRRCMTACCIGKINTQARRTVFRGNFRNILLYFNVSIINIKLLNNECRMNRIWKA